MVVRTLMYGWEFPPRISGGLGVACHAIVRELAKKHVGLTLVLPHVVDTDDEYVTAIDCGAKSDDYSDFDGYLRVKYPKIKTSLRPYACGSQARYWLSNDAVREFFVLLDAMSLPEELKHIARSGISANAGNANCGYSVNLLVEVLRYAMVAGKIASDVKHDVIHAHDWLTIMAALEAKKYTHKPVVLHIHALETDRSGLWVDKRIYAIEKYGMEQADQIVAVSQFTKNNIVKHYGIDPSKITVVHNGIYCNQDGSVCKDDIKSGRPKMVLFVGRITQQKGPYFFIQIAQKVLAKKPDVQFVLAGTGDQMIDMIESVAGMRLGKNVHFTGFLDGERVRDIYKMADVYVMPSVSEPFGLSALEALSYDVPAVISKQSGVAEVLSHSLVADFWDTEDMAAKILAFLEYPVLGRTSLSYSRGDLQDLTWEKAATKIIEVYDKAMRGEKW